MGFTDIISLSINIRHRNRSHRIILNCIHVRICGRSHNLLSRRNHNSSKKLRSSIHAGGRRNGDNNIDRGTNDSNRGNYHIYNGSRKLDDKHSHRNNINIKIYNRSLRNRSK